MDANSGDSVKTAVKNLFAELEKAGFGKYVIRPAAEFNKNGILLLQTNDAAKYRVPFLSALKQYGPEAISVAADDKSVVIIGNTSFAIQEAVYIYLEQLGFRFFLPGEIWTVVPSIKTIFKPVKLLVKPDFEFRTIANGHGYLNLPKPKEDFDNWYRANRLGGTFFVWLGHNYDNIVASLAGEFKQHPEYFAGNVAKGTLPVDPKFNVANKDLVKLVGDVAEKEIQRQISVKMSPPHISMEPSDGGGFCNTPACKEIGGPSDQVFFLANEVAKRIKKYPGAWVGSLAYNEHILPTKFNLEQNIFVMVTNGFNRSRYSTEELLQLWRKKVSKVGVYEYLSVFESDNDIPGRNHAFKPAYIRQSVIDFYKSGARAYQAESTIGWISRGLGQYLLTKLLWNRNVNTDSLKDDFFSKAFGAAAPSIRKLYTAWENNSLGAPFPSDMADWHSWVKEGYNATDDAAVRKRIDQLKIYLHYVVLYMEFQANRTEANMLKLLSYAYQTRELACFATVPVMISLPNYSGFPALGFYGAGEKKWMQNTAPFTDTELQQNFLQDAQKFKKIEGLASYKLAGSFIDLKSIAPATAHKYWGVPHTLWGGEVEYIIRINTKGAGNYLEIKSGMAANPPVDRDVAVKVYASGKENTNPLVQFAQNKKNENERFSLASLSPGLYKVKVIDQEKMFILQFSSGIDYSIVMSPGGGGLLTTSAGGLNEFCFYVPKGTRKFRIAKGVILNLESPAGRILNHENNLSESFYVDVLPGEEGVWTIFNQAGNLYIDGIPPYLGLLPSRMLVPAYLKK